ncbi:ganglioside GM2 activator-like [Tigriopus californicus]|uniref:ganglioside GM2 activator-like n=1 Tax=Tigriopus californicus TaxID=6832 RepID=UPI0027DA351C|nr:ganglioside GM2 activator-like [Tigriopus californicus]XP_059080185.1 ganglioside GM2 activator-like [Tigriopus californicus]XP_059080187.1 ganglioside GM2 activator-like [Tigriopus californicus]
MTACIVTLVTIAFFFLLQPSSGEQSQGGYPHSLHERSIREKHWNSLVGHIINKHHNALLTHHFKAKDLTWENCGSRQDSLKIRSLTISPQVLHFPENLTVDFDASLRQNVVAPLRVKLELKRKLGPIWVKIPCHKQVGSCTYPDICALLREIHVDLPPILQCPFGKGEYKETGARIHVPPAKLPIWMLSGKYSAQAELWDTNGHLGCLKLNIKLA